MGPALGNNLTMSAGQHDRYVRIEDAGILLVALN